MGTTNKLLQTALQKWTHSSRQPEVAVVTYCHTVGENGLGLNDLDGMEDDVLWPEQYDKSDTDVTWWHTNRCSVKGVMVIYFADFSVSYKQVWLQGGLLVLKTGATYTQVYTVVKNSIY